MSVATLARLRRSFLATLSKSGILLSSSISSAMSATVALAGRSAETDPSGPNLDRAEPKAAVDAQAGGRRLQPSPLRSPAEAFSNGMRCDGRTVPPSPPGRPGAHVEYRRRATQGAGQTGRDRLALRQPDIATHTGEAQEGRAEQGHEDLDGRAESL